MHCCNGIGICYDINFPDLAQIYARNHNCGFLVYPGAFEMTTGNWIGQYFIWQLPYLHSEIEDAR